MQYRRLTGLQRCQTSTHLRARAPLPVISQMQCAGASRTIPNNYRRVSSESRQHHQVPTTELQQCPVLHDHSAQVQDLMSAYLQSFLHTLQQRLVRPQGPLVPVQPVCQCTACHDLTDQPTLALRLLNILNGTTQKPQSTQTFINQYEAQMHLNLAITNCRQWAGEPDGSAACCCRYWAMQTARLRQARL